MRLVSRKRLKLYKNSRMKSICHYLLDYLERFMLRKFLKLYDSFSEIRYRYFILHRRIIELPKKFKRRKISIEFHNDDANRKLTDSIVSAITVTRGPFRPCGQLATGNARYETFFNVWRFRRRSAILVIHANFIFASSTFHFADRGPVTATCALR